MRNKPNTSYLTELLLNSEILVYKKKQEKDPKLYHLVGIDNQTCQINLDGRFINFRSIVIKLFHRDPYLIKELDHIKQPSKKTK
jgi:hypothetical protein